MRVRGGGRQQPEQQGGHVAGGATVGGDAQLQQSHALPDAEEAVGWGGHFNPECQIMARAQDDQHHAQRHSSQEQPLGL